MMLGHGSRKRFPWRCWRAMILVPLVTLPVGGTLLIGGLKTRNSEGETEAMRVTLRPARVVPAGPAADESARVPNGRTGLVDVMEKEKIAAGGLIFCGITPRVIITEEEEEERLGILVP